MNDVLQDARDVWLLGTEPQCAPEAYEAAAVGLVERLLKTCEPVLENPDLLKLLAARSAALALRSRSEP